ncbi:2-iminoacetate synthase [Flavobacteriaceae bacterium UJ101]|nr:2-iminoacetate synthase [Flavobacteriaceae bacterium UJ101]
MTHFKTLLNQYNWDAIHENIQQKTTQDVLNALQKNKRNLEDFKALISPAAKPFLEQMAQMSKSLTQKRFGHTMQMYVPLYLSNECQNICTYCGFSFTNKIPRRTLTHNEILKEVTYLKDKGYDHILLVTGEANQIVNANYIKSVIQLIQDSFSNITIEVQPLDQEEYEELIKEGLYAVLVYQETYNQTTYKKHHPKGKKSNFNYRLETPDRLGKAGIHKIGLGTLLGLEDWRTDSFFTALHLQYLQKTYWKTQYSISFPRLRPFSGGIQPKVNMSDADLVQLICAYRLLDEEIELSISTREHPVFRDHIVSLGITSMSAESKTNPGGYTVEKQSLKQFEISDERTTEQMVGVLKKQGIEAVWKDWEYFK